MQLLQTFYDYEVSIYDELNGSNNWNGSVLAAILLAGSFGAMLPTWVPSSPTRTETTPIAGLGSDLMDDHCALTPDVDGLGTTPPTPTPPIGQRKMMMMMVVPAVVGDGSTKPLSRDYAVCARVAAMSAVSALFLLLFVISWQVAASMSFLAGFFACWQYVNVVCLARYPS